MRVMVVVLSLIFPKQVRRAVAPNMAIIAF
jgi:hypothetical protein